MDYLHSKHKDKITVTFMSDDQEILGTATEGDLNFVAIWDKVRANITDGIPLNEEEIILLLNPGDQIGNRLTEFSDRFTHHDGQIYFDGELVMGALAMQIMRVVQETDMENDESRAHLMAVARFGERLMGNEHRNSRDYLLDWLQDRKLTICADGTFIAYKGVIATDKKGHYESSHSGKENMVSVNGKIQPAGRVPNHIGAVVTMERDMINEDVSVGCSQGLHVGTFEYAKDFVKGHGDKAGLLTCSVAPEDVVTVPRDCNYQKIRTCKYTVLEVTPAEYNKAIYNGNAPKATKSKWGWGKGQ